MARDVEQQFLAAISDWLVTLPHDLKILYEVAADANINRPARELAVGAIISTISPNHLPGVPPGDFVNFCDSAILLRLAVKHMTDIGGEGMASLKERFPEFFGSLDEGVELCRRVLAEHYDWLCSKVERLNTLEYKSKKISNYIEDEEAGEFLYEEGLEFATEYDIDEDMLSDRLKKVSTVLEAIAKRRRFDAHQTG